MDKQNTYRLGAVLAAVLTTATAHAAAAAEANADDELAEIVVTGYRASLNAAEEIKKNDANVVDSIVARDVGKLPDVTVGDALQRITGVQVTRNNNQVTGVNVRGLPNVITTLNGDEIFTTTQRTFNFQNLPAEVLAGLNVYKTSSRT